MTRAGQLWLSACGVGCGGIGAWMLGITFFPQTPPMDLPVKLILAGFGAFLIWAGVYCAVGAWRFKTLFWPDRVSQVNAFATRTLHRVEVKGFRVQRGRGGAVLVLFPIEEGRQILRLAVGQLDAPLQRWLSGLRDLDQADHAAGERELLARTDLGATPELRRAAVERWRRPAQIANALGFVIPAWAWLFPRPFDLALSVCALAPLAAIGLVAASRGVVTLGETSRSEPRPGVPGLLFAGFGIMIRALLDLHLIDWSLSLALGAATGAIFTVIARRVDPHALSGRVAVGFLWLAASAYAWGLVAEANSLFDRAAPQTFRTRVVDKYESAGERHTSWNLTFAPWGPVKTQGAEDVGRRVYDRLNKGDIACVSLHPGALRIRWYEVDRCA
jgi:hypothetical protein